MSSNGEKHCVVLITESFFSKMWKIQNENENIYLVLMNCVAWIITEVDDIFKNLLNWYKLCELELFNIMTDNYFFICWSFSTGNSSTNLKPWTSEALKILYGKIQPNCIFFYIYVFRLYRYMYMLSFFFFFSPG